MAKCIHVGISNACHHHYMLCFNLNQAVKISKGVDHCDCISRSAER